MNSGYVEQEDSLIDKRRKLYRPLIEPELEPEKIKKLRESFLVLLQGLTR